MRRHPSPPWCRRHFTKAEQSADAVRPASTSSRGPSDQRQPPPPPGGCRTGFRPSPVARRPQGPGRLRRVPEQNTGALRYAGEKFARARPPPRVPAKRGGANLLPGTVAPILIGRAFVPKTALHPGSSPGRAFSECALIGRAICQRCTTCPHLLPRAIGPAATPTSSRGLPRPPLAKLECGPDSAAGFAGARCGFP